MATSGNGADPQRPHHAAASAAGRRPLNATAASLLGFLQDGALTGWDLVTRAQAVIGSFWSLTQSQVYRELATMADAGLVEAGERGRRDRQPYALTEAGRDAFARWIEVPPGPETIRHPLLLTLAFGRHLRAGRLEEFLAQHRAAHESRLAQYEQRQTEARAAGARTDPFALATLEFGLSYERAVLDWLGRLPAILAEEDR
jgi:DNA-binding PadR family transcriptional regulator